MRNLITAQEYCSSVFDGTHATPKPQKCGKPLVTSKHILNGKLDIANAYNISEEDYLEINKRSKVHQWDILFSMIGTIGTIYLEKSEHIDYAIKNIGVFSCRNEKKARYLYYFLQTNFAKRHIQKQLAGAVQKFLSLGELRKFPVFSFDERSHKNISILNNLDEKIELNNKISSEFEQFARTLYDYWFVQFDFPDEFGRPYKSSGGKMVYNEILKRDIPAGWKVDNFKNYATIASGFPFNSDDYIENGTWKIVTIKNVQQGYLDRSAIDTIAQIPNKMPDFVKLQPGDILISLTGNIGRMCMVDGYCFLLNQRVGKILSAKDFLLFAYLFLSDEENQIRLRRISSGSSQQNLSPIQAVDSPFTVPNVNILRQFNDQIEPLYNQLLILKQQSEMLKTLRDFLLPMLMNGQVTINS